MVILYHFSIWLNFSIPISSYKTIKRLFSFENNRFSWSDWGDSSSLHLDPKGRRNIFSDSFRPFPVLSAPKLRALRTSCLHRFQVLRAGLWSDMWSNTASRPGAAILIATGREGFSFSRAIVPTQNRLCNCFPEGNAF